ncbi:uncharacterized protein ACNS7B_020918 [Menidia menidia]
MILSLISTLSICCITGVVAPGSDRQAVRVRPGGDATLLCSNFSSRPTQIVWFWVGRARPVCLAFLFSASSPASGCGLTDQRLDMSSNGSTLFLRIRRARESDSGLHFCGHYLSESPVIRSATYLEVEAETPQLRRPMCGLLGGLSLLLAMVIAGLVFKMNKLRTELNAQRAKGSQSEDVT